MKQPQITMAEAKDYLALYLGTADWDAALKRLHSQLLRRHRNKAADTMAVMHQCIPCAILMPMYEGTKIPEDPTKVLFWASSPSNYEQRNWHSDLLKEIRRDKEIRSNRHLVATLGVIHPIDYSPMTRQAFNWIYGKGLEKGHITDDNKKDVEKKFKNLVSVYGGQVICSLFNRHSRTSPVLDNVVNWYSGYFIERLIYEIYDVQTVLKVKKQELEKTNKDLIVKLTDKN
jgi:hypothetical protein